MRPALGQVHQATTLQGAPLAVKLQYPEMASAVETDVAQLKTLLSLIPRSGTRHRSVRGHRGDRRAAAGRARL